MLESQRLKLTFWGLFSHYFVILLLFTPLFMTLYVSTQEGKQEHMQDLVLISGVFAVVGVALGVWQHAKLKFKKFHTRIPEKEFLVKLEDIITDQGWHLEEYAPDYLVITTPFNFLSWGERITMIREMDTLLINSICDPNKKTSVSSWGGNKKNVELLSQHLTTPKPHNQTVS